MAFTVREFRELLSLLPEEIQDYQVDICKELFNDGSDNYNPWYDSVWQIQIKKRDWPLNNVVIIHGDYTCHCDEDGIYPVVNEDNKPIILN